MPILGGILAASDGKTQFVVGLPGDVSCESLVISLY